MTVDGIENVFDLTTKYRVFWGSLCPCGVLSRVVDKVDRDFKHPTMGI
jgi:hypothetical protein